MGLWLVSAIAHLPIEGIPHLADVRVNGVALLFTAALALVTGLVFGSLPAARAYRIGLDAQLRDGIRSTASTSSRSVMHALVGSQVALSIILLVGAGLLPKSFAHLLAVEPGFRSDHLLTMRLSLSGQRYGTREQMAQFYEALIERVRGLPGVRAAGAISNLPIQSDGWSDGYVIEGHDGTGPVPPNALIRIGFPGYFQAVGIPLLEGRDFSGGDAEGAAPVAIVDEALARL